MRFPEVNNEIQVDFTNFTIRDLDSLIESATIEKTNRMKQMIENYGEWFSDLIGKEKLFSLADFPIKTISPDTDRQHFPNIKIKPSELGNRSAMRGIFGQQYPRPFVAIKIDILNEEMITLTTVVEVIYREYPLSGDREKDSSHENTYEIAYHTITENGAKITSCIHNYGSNITRIESTEQGIKAISALLKGQKLPIRPVELPGQLYSPGQKWQMKMA